MPDQTLATAEARTGRSRLLIWPLAIFAVLALLFALALRSGDPSRLPSALIGRPAPIVVLPALEGLSDGARTVGGFSSADLANGEVSVVNFWASWCAPCVQEHPLLVALKERTGVKLYGVNYKDQAGDGAPLPRPLRQSVRGGGRRCQRPGRPSTGASPACRRRSSSTARARSSTSTSGRSRPRRWRSKIIPMVRAAATR